MTEELQIAGDIYRIMKSKLNVYMNEHHSGIEEDDVFISYRADEAAQAYSEYIEKGYDSQLAKEHAVEILYQDL